MISEDEIKLMVKMANQQGVIEQKESEFIQNILRFADRDAYPIPQLIVLDLDLPNKTGFEVP